MGSSSRADAPREAGGMGQELMDGDVPLVVRNVVEIGVNGIVDGQLTAALEDENRRTGHLLGDRTVGLDGGRRVASAGLTIGQAVSLPQNHFARMGDDDCPGESERFHGREVAIDVRTDLGTCRLHRPEQVRPLQGA